jgi:hypothetical protein
MKAMMEHEVEGKLGRWGSQQAYRHGRQEGYVVFAGQKLPVPKPRVRSRDHKEVALESYQAFQSRGRMQKAVAKRMMQHCSTRDYESAVQELTEGYGIKKSSVSRHFKASTAAELKMLLERPVARGPFGADHRWPVFCPPMCYRRAGHRPQRL